MLVYGILFVGMLLASSDALAWSPLPPPDADEAFRYRQLTDGQPVELQPGESVEVTPDRMSNVRVQIAPAELTGYVEIDHVAEGPNHRTQLRARPLQLDAGDLSIATEPMTSARLRIEVSEDAPQPLTIAVAQVEGAEPFVYWEWWHRELVAWIEERPEQPPPVEVELPEARQLREHLGELSQFVTMIDQFAQRAEQRRFARYLAQAQISKLLHTLQTPRSRYFTQDDALGPLARTRVDTGSFSNEPTRVSEKIPVAITVRGPGVLRFGVRALKQDNAPDVMTRYSVAVSAGDHTVHDEEFSSRAARVQSLEVEGGDTYTPEDVQFVRSSRGDIVGWRRNSQFWVPPGDHTFEFEPTGADVLLDAQILRARSRVEKFVSQLTTTQLTERVEAALAEPQDAVDLVLKAELSGLVYRFDAARQLVDAARRRDLPDDLNAWLDMREARWFAPPIEELEQLTASARARQPQDPEPHVLWALGERALELERFTEASELFDLIPESADESPRKIGLRAEAALKGVTDRSARWRAFVRAYELARRNAADEQLRTVVQRLWWSTTYWSPLSSPGATTMLVPMGDPGELLTRESVQDRSTLLFALPEDRPFRIWAPRAPDRADRLRRLRLAARQTPEGDHAVSINDREFGLAALEPLTYFDFAIEAGRSHRVERLDGEVFSTRPPDDAVELDASTVFEPREAPHIEENERHVWDLPESATTRFVRIHLYVSPGATPSRIDIDDGIGAIRHLFITPNVGADPEQSSWVRAFVRVDPGATELTLRPRGAGVRAALDMRRPRALPERVPITIEVDLDSPDFRLVAVRELSKSLAHKESHSKRMKRAEILMSLDQDALARVDLERILDSESVPATIRARVERLHAAITIRLGPDWLELDDAWLEGKSVRPLTPWGALSPAETSCTKPECPGMRLRGLADESPESTIAVFRWLAENASRERWVFDSEMSRVALDLIEENPEQAPIGLAAEIYTRMWHVMQTFPSNRNRARWYGALRWTRWESISTLAGGSFLARHEPPRDPVNSHEWDAPRTDDPLATSVEFALSGTDWTPDSTYSMFAFQRRILRFSTREPEILDLQSTCFDRRPDLQPADSGGCQLDVELTTNGSSVEATPEGPVAPGQSQVWRWRLEPEAEYTLTLRREDGLKGRTHLVRPLILRASEAGQPLTPRILRRTDVVPAETPARLTVHGPVALRIDARGIAPEAAQQLEIAIDGKPQILNLSTLEEDGSEMMNQSLTRSTRTILWLDEARRYDLDFRSDSGFATLHVALRLDNYEVLLQPEAQGWRKTETVEERQPHEPTRTVEFARSLTPTDLLESPLPFALTSSLSFLSPGFNLFDEVERASDRPLLQASAGGYLRLTEAVWIDGDMRSRTRFEGPPVFGLALDAYALLPWSNLRTETRTQVWTQDLDRLRAAARAEFRLSRPTSLGNDWLFLPSARITGRWQSLDAVAPRADVVVFNQYALDHPLTYDLQMNLWFRPFVNAMATAGFRPIFNTDASLDQLRLEAAARALLESTELRATYGIRWLTDDAHRSQDFVFHDFTLFARLGYWGTRSHLFSLDASTRLTLAPSSSSPTRVRFNVGLTYWFSESGLQARPSSEGVWDDLLEPRYFLD